MTDSVCVAVVGAGQSGLSTSYYLSQLDIEHVVLEQFEVGASWRRRWESFTLVTPNSLNRLPGMGKTGPPEAFLDRAETIQYLEDFVASFNPPLRCETRVFGARRAEPGFELETSAGPLRCEHLVVATNIFQKPRIPRFAARLAPQIVQLHSSEYRSPADLAPGAVLVVGSGQSGTQIASELHEAGRDVVLSVSRAGRMPRRYRGRDVMEWLRVFGAFEQRVEELESPDDRFAARPHVTGKGGGATLDLRRLGQGGVQLVGKLTDADGDRLSIAADLRKNLEAADDFARELCESIDLAIEKTETRAPADHSAATPVDWAPSAIDAELSLTTRGIRTIVWATGYAPDFGWIGVDIFDSDGYPVHERGITTAPGLYFACLPWLHTHGSSSFYGAAHDAAHIVEHIADCILGDDE